MKDEAGYFSGLVPIATGGMLYRYRLDNGDAYPDPCSRYQPQGPHGPSLIVDPSTYAGVTLNGRSVRMQGQVIYELHVGTFTLEGTPDATIAQLDELKDCGVTLIELMPLAEFPGRWNWGYDGVDLFAPAHVYGDPDALKRPVDAADERGLGVILDVVYNHFGPDCYYLPAFSDLYLTDRHPNEWGQAINLTVDQAAGACPTVLLNTSSNDGYDWSLSGVTFRISVHVLAELSLGVRRGRRHARLC